MKAIRTLYPEYDLLPDEILAEDVRRRYEPQFPLSWDSDFISKGGFFSGKVNSSILADLYALRGDAYIQAARRSDALADYQRLKSDAWTGEERSLPRNVYFDERGARVATYPLLGRLHLRHSNLRAYSIRCSHCLDGPLPNSVLHSGNG